MKIIFPTIMFIVIIFGCKPTEKTHKQLKRELGYEVVRVPIVSGNDTIISHELRFYKIQSALSSMSMMYDLYDKWNTSYDGRYQTNVPQLVWENVTIPNSDKSYTISASGTETETNFFSNLVIYDNSNQDCLDSNYKGREELIEYFTIEISKPRVFSKFLKVYRGS